MFFLFGVKLLQSQFRIKRAVIQCCQFTIMNRVTRGRYQQPIIHSYDWPSSDEGCCPFTVRGCCQFWSVLSLIGLLVGGFTLTTTGYIPGKSLLEEKPSLQTRRVVGPVLLVIGVIMLCGVCCQCHIEYKRERVYRRRLFGREAMATGNRQEGTVERQEETDKRQEGTDTATASTSGDPANKVNQQPYYGQPPAYQPEPYPNTPSPPPIAISEYPPSNPPPQHPYPPQHGQGVQPYQTDIPPLPSYESVFNPPVQHPYPPQVGPGAQPYQTDRTPPPPAMIVLSIRECLQLQVPRPWRKWVRSVKI